MTAWSERLIGRELALNYFQRRHLVVVPNCGWTGNECDLLVVTKNLRIIDVEIKISRADLRADAKKYKWVNRVFRGYGPEECRYDERGRLLWANRPAIYDDERLQWPSRVWKHYYAVPMEIWDDSLAENIPAASGLLLLHRGKRGEVLHECRRPAKPNRDAEKISPESAVDIARLASLRMWDAYSKLEARK